MQRTAESLQRQRLDDDNDDDDNRGASRTLLREKKRGMGDGVPSRRGRAGMAGAAACGSLQLIVTALTQKSVLHPTRHTLPFFSERVLASCI
jgi:hypothetical protein